MAPASRVLKISDAWHWFAEAEQLLLNARALLLRGWQVDVACQPESPLWERAGAAGATLHPLPGIRGGNPLARPANVLRIARLIDQLRPDLVHPYRSPPHALAAAARAVASHKLPLVRSRGAAQRLRRHPLNRWLYRSADAVIASSSAVASDLFELGVDSARTHVVRGGVDITRVSGGDPEAFRQLHQLPSGVPLIGMLARIDDVKGHRFAVDAVAELQRRGVESVLLCAGEPWGDAQERLEQRISRKGVKDRVRLLGRVDAVADFLAALDVAVVASTGSEIIARGLMEKMAASCAVIATQVGVIPELLDQSVGVVVPPFDALALADALEALLHDPERRARIGAAARKRILQSYSLERVGEHLEQIYVEAQRRFSSDPSQTPTARSESV